MNDADLAAEIHRVHVDLAHVRQTLAELATMPAPEPALVGAVGFADAGAVAEFLDGHRVPVIRDERRAVALVIEKNLVSCAGIAVEQQRSRARRQAYHDRARIIFEGADTLRAAAAIIQAQIEACRPGGVAPVLTGLPTRIEAEIKQAEAFFGRNG